MTTLEDLEKEFNDKIGSNKIVKIIVQDLKRIKMGHPHNFGPWLSYPEFVEKLGLAEIIKGINIRDERYYRLTKKGEEIYQRLVEERGKVIKTLFDSIFYGE